MRQATVQLLAMALLATPAAAHEQAARLDSMEVTGRSLPVIGAAQSASAGLIGQPEIAARPFLRIGELLEAVPGFIATQHSGSGKANQYFLRGFNLDHGTDFAFSVDGVPVNQPTHGHGQGYSDLNFLIPELVQEIAFRKGPYYPQVGDFSSAGGAALRTADTLPAGIFEAGAGQDGYARLLLADSPHLGDGHLLYGLDLQTYDGPWLLPEDLRRFAGILKYSTGTEARGWRLAAQGYASEWSATDQIPQRAVDAGMLDRLAAVDESDRGESRRFSLSAERWNEIEALASRTNAYAVYYDLNLFSNFTYFLDDPVNGDQFEQVDRRVTLGLGHTWRYAQSAQMLHELGVSLRHDRIGEVGLHRTAQRRRLSTVSTAAVDETALGLHYALEQDWAHGLRSVLGLRADGLLFDVESDRPENSGNADDAKLSPKLLLAWSPRAGLEAYAAAGYALHSNDARGTTITLDPVGGGPAERVDPLVRSRGAELGLRVLPLAGLHSTLALWVLELDQELLFVGDAGNTEATRPSRRHGVEWTNYWRINQRFTADFDLALTQAAFDDFDPAGREIPGAVDRVVAAGLSARWPLNFSSALRLRHIGPRPLIEDDSQRSAATTLLNFQTGSVVSQRYPNKSNWLSGPGGFAMGAVRVSS